MQILILLITLIAANNSVCDEEFAKAYKLAASYIYPKSPFIGTLLPLESHKCHGGLSPYWNPGKVALRPLYNDSGLPLYDMFEEEWEELVGFEFRSWIRIVKTCKLITPTTWHCWEDNRELWRGYSIALTEREKLLYAIIE